MEPPRCSCICMTPRAGPAPRPEQWSPEPALKSEWPRACAGQDGGPGGGPGGGGPGAGRGGRAGWGRPVLPAPFTPFQTRRLQSHPRFLFALRRGGAEEAGPERGRVQEEGWDGAWPIRGRGLRR